MTSDELQRLRRPELLHIVLSQRAEIEQLQAALTELERRLADTTAQRDHLAGIAASSGSQTGMAEPALITQWTLCEQATRDALRCLDDTARLAQGPLAELMAKIHGTWPQGCDVQQALYRALEATRPAAGQPHRGRRRRRYEVLRLTYLEKGRPAEIARLLAISERQYYRGTSKPLSNRWQAMPWGYSCKPGRKSAVNIL